MYSLFSLTTLTKGIMWVKGSSEGIVHLFSSLKMIADYKTNSTWSEKIKQQVKSSVVQSELEIAKKLIEYHSLVIQSPTLKPLSFASGQNNIKTIPSFSLSDHVNMSDKTINSLSDKSKSDKGEKNEKNNEKINEKNEKKMYDQLKEAKDKKIQDAVQILCTEIEKSIVEINSFIRLIFDEMEKFEKKWILWIRTPPNLDEYFSQVQKEFKVFQLYLKRLIQFSNFRSF